MWYDNTRCSMESLPRDEEETIQKAVKRGSEKKKGPAKHSSGPCFVTGDVCVDRCAEDHSPVFIFAEIL